MHSGNSSLKKLEACKLKQSELDPCLFVGTKVIYVFYVDDLLFWSTSEKHIQALAVELQAEGGELGEEGNAAGFLGVKLTQQHKSGQISLTQVGLIDQIIESLGLQGDTVNPKSIPAERKPLTKDSDGNPKPMGCLLLLCHLPVLLECYFIWQGKLNQILLMLLTPVPDTSLPQEIS